MPELPEVETVVRTLRPRLCGARIGAVSVAHGGVVRSSPGSLDRLLSDSRIVRVRRRGKRIEMDLDDGRVLRVHLGMTGRLRLEPAGAPAAAHTHVVWHIDCGHGRLELRFIDPRRIGGVWLLATETAARDDLGPEACDIGAAALAQRLGRTRRAIKTALLDQSLIAGLGNIYADEALHAAGIDPRTPADRLSSATVARLAKAIRRILRLAIRHGGSTVRDYVDGDGRPGSFQKLHRVYGRAGRPCRRCRATIRRIVLGGRSAHYCPACQRRRGG